MDSIKKLTDLFSRFPGIGRRTAGRFVFYLIRQDKKMVDELIAAIQELKQQVTLCADCFNPFEPFDPAQGKLCGVCQSPARDKKLLCIVEKESDLLTIEATGRYKGLYFILGNPPRLEPLKNRVKNGMFTEIIMALNPTPEGRSTSVLVERVIREYSSYKLQDSRFKITHLAQGLPVGGELEYADEETLESAFEGRK